MSSLYCLVNTEQTGLLLKVDLAYTLIVLKNGLYSGTYIIYSMPTGV